MVHTVGVTSRCSSLVTLFYDRTKKAAATGSVYILFIAIFSRYLCKVTCYLECFAASARISFVRTSTAAIADFAITSDLLSNARVNLPDAFTSLFLIKTF